MGFTEQYDVVVVGAGHAGCEAAMAAARMGLRTALFTLNLDLIAQMSCNPAVGGIAKGHLVREVDALGGVMGELTDRAGIQFRLLNTRRGPAVWSPRAQCDKSAYRTWMREYLEREANLRIVQAEVAEVMLEAGPPRRVTGVLLRDGAAGIKRDRFEAYVWLLMTSDAGYATPDLQPLESDLGTARTEEAKAKARKLEAQFSRRVIAHGCTGWDGEFDRVPSPPPPDIQQFCR